MKFFDLPHHWKIIAAILSGIGTLVGLLDSLATIKEKGPEALDILGSVTYFTGTVTLYGLGLLLLFFLVQALASWLNFSEEASRIWAWIITIGILIFYVPKDFLASLAFQHSSLSSTSPLLIRGVGAIVLIIAGFALYMWLEPIISTHIDKENKQTSGAQESGATPSPAPSASSVSSTTTVTVDKEVGDDVGDEITIKLLPLSKGTAPEPLSFESVNIPAGSAPPTDMEADTGAMAAPTVNTSDRKGKSGQAKKHIWLRWIVVICVAAVVFALSNDSLSSRFVSTTPGVMFNKFCSALVEGDYQTAYTQLSSDIRSRVKEEQFAKDYRGINTCIPGTTKFFYFTFTATLTLSDFAGRYTELVTLKNETVLMGTISDWKIDGFYSPSLAAKTLDLFCNDLNTSPKKYREAYAQFSEGFQKAHSEQEFEQEYANYTSCKHDQPDVSRLDAATHMTLSDTSGSYKAIVMFIPDSSGYWRIANIIFP